MSKRHYNLEVTRSRQLRSHASSRTPWKYLHDLGI
ncbi:unnamed protein product [Rhodiola kirilowii]